VVYPIDPAHRHNLLNPEARRSVQSHSGAVARRQVLVTGGDKAAQKLAGIEQAYLDGGSRLGQLTCLQHSSSAGCAP
jgi:hypothetical protein